MKHLCLSGYLGLGSAKETEIYLEIAYANEYEIAFFKIYKRTMTSIDLIYQNFIFVTERNLTQDVVDWCEGILKQTISINCEIPQEGLNFLKKR